jgi:hypothetical protein
MKHTWWQIFLIIYLVLVAFSLLTNVQVVFMGVLTGIAAALAALCLALGK